MGTDRQPGPPPPRPRPRLTFGSESLIALPVADPRLGLPQPLDKRHSVAARGQIAAWIPIISSAVGARMEMLDQTPPLPVFQQDDCDAFGLDRAPCPHGIPVCQFTGTRSCPPSGSFPCAILKKVGDDVIEEIDHQTNFAGCNMEAHVAPSAFWALGLGRLHILDKSKARQSKHRQVFQSQTAHSHLHATPTPPPPPGASGQPKWYKKESMCSGAS